MSEGTGASIDIDCDDLVARARATLSLAWTAELATAGGAPLGGDHGLDASAVHLPGRPHKAAAVLVPVIRRSAATILLTQRVTTLRAHAGQIAFPGGRIDPGDESPAAAALREAREEVGLHAGCVTPLGYLDPYLTGTGYLVTPTLAVVEPPFTLTLNPAEVATAFEVPLAFLMDPANHRRESRDIGGRLRNFYAMPFGDHYIWGATAGMLRNLYERLYG